jgi:bacillopeptidase F
LKGGFILKRKRQRQISLFSILASLLLIFSLITPVATNAESGGKLNQSLKDQQQQTNTKAKVSDRLLKAFKKDEKVTFLVKFDKQANVEKAAKNALSTAKKSKLSAFKAELAQRSAVVSELKSTAISSQENVKQYLNEQVKKGNAKDVTSYHIVNGMAVTATKEVAQKVASFSEVDKILPNETRQLIKPVEKNTKAAKAQVADDEVEWSIDRIGAPAAWDKGIDGSGTVVASIDTGVQWDHPALKEKYRGYDASTEKVDHDFNWFDATSGKDEPYDDIGHGTHTVGTMVGSEPDGSNQIGVAPGAKFIAVKAFTEDGGTDTDLLAAGEWVIAPKDADGNERVDLAPDVVNNSWGGGPGLDEWYRDMVKAWRSAGIFPEFSAGNVDLFNPGGPGSVASPSNYPESFATGATDSDDMIAGFSLRGPSPYDEIKPDISAPGVNIRSSIPGSEYGGNSGTSMAGPAVSGVALLLRQVDGNISVDDMEEILTNTATERTDDEYPESPNNGYGAGIVNAYDAVSSMQDGLGTVKGKVTTAADGKDASKGKHKIGLHVMKEKSQAKADNSIGLAAKVSVLESGRAVNTDPDDGSYSLLHAAGDFTLQAEAYGYQTSEQSATIVKDETSKVDFSLKKVEQNTVSGKITDEATGEPVEGATVMLVEDANIAPVESDADGNYSIKAYKDEYTVKVLAKNYHGKEVKVNLKDGDAELNIELEPLYTYPGGEIGYDDGTAENARAFYDAGNGWAVKMSLPEGKDTGIVTDGVFKFWGEEFPSPGGTEFAVEVWDASGKDGLPGKKLAGPIDAEAIRDEGEWTVVDLGKESIQVDGDFYMVYIQTHENTKAPALATDEDGPNAKRSYQFVSGDWEASPAEEGNYMIRARVDYEIDTPEITSPEDGTLTNDADVTVEGTASPTTTIQLENNGEEAGSQKVGDDGKFSVPMKLTEGENAITAISQKDGNPVGESDPVTVVLDTKAPELTIDNPKDGDKTNKETVTVEGTVKDENLDTVEVNGQKAKVKDGSYSKRILLDNGKNKIEVVATDKAGNSAKESVTLQVKYDGPEIENLTPTEDVTIEAGESVKVEFDSEPGLKTTFFIHMPLTNAKASVANATELPMMETSEGHYEGYWTATKNVKAEGAVIEVKAVDNFKNETRQKTEGKLFINVD